MLIGLRCIQVYGFSFFVSTKILLISQLSDPIYGDFFGWAEIGTSHIADKASPQLAGSRAVVKVCIEVSAADEQLPFAHANLKDERKRTCREPVVDDAHNGLDAWREEVITDGIAVRHGILPLVVAVPLSGELPQRRVAGIA